MPKFRRSPECLFDIIDQTLEALELESRLLVEVDCPDDIAIPGPVRHVESLVESLVSQAASQMQDAGELTIFGWESEEVCELEISDTGADIECRDCTPPIASTLAGAELYWQNCPQGGAAVTARFRKAAAQSKAA